MILKEMKVLDQEIAPPRPVAEERTHLVLRLRIDLAPLREFTRPTAPGTWVNAARRLRAIRLATWWMMDVHSLSVTSDGFVIRLYVPAAPRSQGGLRPI